MRILTGVKKHVPVRRSALGRSMPMPSNMVNKFSARYALAAFILLVFVPAGAYVLFSHFNILKTWPLFQSVTGWCTVAVLVWLAGLLFMQMATYWSKKIDRAFDARGFTTNERIRNIWNMTLMPAILGCLLALYTFLEFHHPREEFSTVQLLILIIGFIPVTLYGLARARQITKSVSGERLTSSQETSHDQLNLKWWPFAVIILTFLLTPFFGAAIAAGQLRRQVPRYRVLISSATVLSGFLVTWAVKPLAKTLKEFRQGDPVSYQALALYTTLAVFTGAAYVLVIKFASSVKRQPACK
jgi:hypothetical protein